MKKLEEKTIEKTVYSGTNDRVVYDELYKINGITAKVHISTDFCNTFGAYIYTLVKETQKWNELYKIHKTLLKVYADSNNDGYFESNIERLKSKESFYIGKFKEDTDKLKAKLIELLF